MSLQLTLSLTTNAISSPGSASGATHSDKPDGQTISPSGPVVAHASLSARQAKELGLVTTGTCGGHSFGSSNSVALKQSLVSKLAQKMDLLGGTLFKLTWKERVTPLQHSIYALRASALLTSANGCIGWPTPRHGDGGKNNRTPQGCRNELIRRNMKPEDLAQAVQLAGWPTAASRDWKSSASNLHGQNARPLNEVARLAGWNTPAASDGNGGKRPHPDTTMTGQHPEGRKVSMGLASQVHIGFIKTEPARYTATGELLTGSTVGMTVGGQLNPAHSRWLMGLPPEWDDCAAMVTLSSHRSRKPSSKPTRR